MVLLMKQLSSVRWLTSGKEIYAPKKLATITIDLANVQDNGQLPLTHESNDYQTTTWSTGQIESCLLSPLGYFLVEVGKVFSNTDNFFCWWHTSHNFSHNLMVLENISCKKKSRDETGSLPNTYAMLAFIPESNNV